MANNTVPKLCSKINITLQFTDTLCNELSKNIGHTVSPGFIKSLASCNFDNKLKLLVDSLGDITLTC